jgi:hypothetical protein
VPNWWGQGSMLRAQGSVVPTEARKSCPEERKRDWLGDSIASPPKMDVPQPNPQ